MGRPWRARTRVWRAQTKICAIEPHYGIASVDRANQNPTRGASCRNREAAIAERQLNRAILADRRDPGRRRPLSASLAAAQTTKRVVKEAHNQPLGKTVLTANNGLTLYSLSVEKHGTFICKGSCLKDWHPLVVAAGVKPTGPVALGTVKRPDGRRR